MSNRRVQSKASDKVKLTRQEFKAEADINNLTRRYLPGQFIGDPRATRQPVYGDFTLTSASYHEMMNTVQDAEQAFRALPARTRGRFANDPYQWLRFIEDPKNIAESVRLGIMRLKPGFEIVDGKVVEVARQSEMPFADENEPGGEFENIEDDESQPRKKGKATAAPATPPKGAAPKSS